MKTTKTVPVSEMFRAWEGCAAAIKGLLEEGAHVMFGPQGKRYDRLVDDQMGDQVVIERRMTETLDGTPEAAFCKLRIALDNAKVAGVDDSCWDLVRSALGDLQVAVTPQESVH